ncbi:MAG: hypothetical protein KKG59_03525 [Nanoarchaeota archaeon]|nr:hypothetical protein [Nanoarchaeota archaeon]
MGSIEMLLAEEDAWRLRPGKSVLYMPKKLLIPRGCKFLPLEKSLTPETMAMIRSAGILNQVWENSTGIELSTFLNDDNRQPLYIDLKVAKVRRAGRKNPYTGIYCSNLPLENEGKPWLVNGLYYGIFHRNDHH